MSYAQPSEGEWVRPVESGYKMACCDCGLVHTMNFKVVAGRALFQVFRNNRSTAQMRRHHRITVRVVDEVSAASSLSLPVGES